MPSTDPQVTQRDIARLIAGMDDAIARAEEQSAAFTTAVRTARLVLVKARDSSATSADVTMMGAAAQQAGRASAAPGEPGQALDEWKECRATVDRCDKLLVDLRKTGFSFITAVVGASSFLFVVDPSKAFLIDQAKATLMWMLALLIVVLYWIDLAHQTLLQAAVDRAGTLEDALQFKLTREIGKRFVSVQPFALGFTIYVFLLAATSLIFYESLLPSSSERHVVTSAAGLGFVSICLLAWVGHPKTRPVATRYSRA
jgi:hypothetical protein